jgi:hypothetical protein
MLKLNTLSGFGAGKGKLVNTTDFYEDLTTLSLTGDCEVCLDAGDSTSYPGSGTKWLDISGNGHDFFLGAAASVDGDEPTFNGVSGGLSSSEYFTYDGSNDMFQYDTTVPAFAQSWHKNNADFTIIFWHYFDSANAGQIICTFTGSGHTNTGMTIQAGGYQSHQFVCANGTSSPPLNFIADTPPLGGAYAGWRMTGLSLDEAAGAGGSFWVENDQYHQYSASDTFDGTYTAPDAGACDGELMLGIPDSGRKTAGVMFFSSSLTKAEMDSIYNQTKTRFL